MDSEEMATPEDRADPVIAEASGGAGLSSLVAAAAIEAAAPDAATAEAAPAAPEVLPAAVGEMSVEVPADVDIVADGGAGEERFVFLESQEWDMQRAENENENEAANAGEEEEMHDARSTDGNENVQAAQIPLIALGIEGMDVPADDLEQLMDDRDSTSPDLFSDADDEEPGVGTRRWVIDAVRFDSAIRVLIEQGRHREGGIASLLDRNNLLQHIRRMVYSLEHERTRNRSNPTEGDQGMEADDENEADAEGGGGGVQNGEEPEIPENPVRFDTNLPAEHSYLGTNMNRVSGVNYLDVGQRHHMMLFMHQHILFPGEVLPFIISSSVMEADIDAQNGLLFGVCFPFLTDNEIEEAIYGVTCQIYEKGTDSRGNMVIKSRALQRFVTNGGEFSGPLQFIAADPRLKCYGYVKVLPEIYLREPLKCINMGSLNRFRDLESMQPAYRRFQAATTPWPAHVYEYYSIETIVNRARAQLAQHKIDTMPVDPVQLSFWLVRNLHLSEMLIRQIFTTDSVNTRLKLISNTFKEDAIFICRYCGNKIANCRELFAMSKYGVQTQYCNSAGYIHETNTLYNVIRNSISYSGTPSSEFSWFPGYLWHIIVCKSCSRHIGWEFKALEPNLVPKSFFGISSSSVRVSVPVNVPRDPRTVIYRSLMRLARRQMQ